MIQIFLIIFAFYQLVYSSNANQTWYLILISIFVSYLSFRSNNWYSPNKYPLLCKYVLIGTFSDPKQSQTFKTKTKTVTSISWSRMRKTNHKQMLTSIHLFQCMICSQHGRARSKHCEIYYFLLSQVMLPVASLLFGITNWFSWIL